MTQAATIHPRSGWKQEENDLLFGAVREAAAEGRPLRDVFISVGEELQRKPNSIRNYYYARVKEQPELAPSKTTFRSFDREELHLLLRDVLMARGRGESVRACVTRRAGGDRSAMLRYQNKYRSILKNRPELLMEVARELRQEGLPCPENVAACRRYGQQEQLIRAAALPEGWEKEPGVMTLLDGLAQLLRCMETREAALMEQNAALKERAEADRAEADMNEPQADPAVDEASSAPQVPYEKWLKARQEADRLRVEVDLLKIAFEEAEKSRAVCPDD